MTIMNLEQPQFTRGGIILMLQSQMPALSVQKSSQRCLAKRFSTLLKPHQRAFLTCRLDLEAFGLGAVMGILKIQP
jgi:hypothetical protein